MKAKRLSRLVRLRELVEKTHVTELEVRKRSLDEAAQHLATTHDRMESLDHSETTASADELLRIARFQAHLEEQAELQKDEIGHRESAVKLGLEIVRRAWQERRLLQHMQENAQGREAFDEQRETWKQQDALALIAYVAPRNGEEDTP